jgi:Zn-dependent protease with chaperone function
MSYNGIGLHSQFERGRISGIITITQDHILFSYEGGAIKFPIRGIEISHGGAGNRIIYFNHPDFKDWSVYCGDTSIEKDPFLSGHDDGKKTISKLKTTRRILWILGGSVLGVFAILIGSVFMFRKQLVYQIATTIPVEWEQKAGEQIFKSIEQTHTLVKDSTLQAQLNQLVAPLVAEVAKEDTSFRFKFYIVEDTTLNAFALPGGGIVVNSGLILRAESPEEVLGVLGHEMAHVTRRHHARGLIASRGVYYVASFFLGGGSDLVDLIINTGSTLQSLQYDRSLESEADEKGWEYVVKAGINPQGMISFFKKLEEAQHPIIKGAENKMNILSTHPATAERIEQLEKKKKDLPSGIVYKAVAINFAGFQKLIKEKTEK